MAENHGDPQKFDDALAKAKTSDKWMAAVWEIRDGKVVLLNRTTISFPRGDFLRVVTQLAGACADDTLAAEQGQSEIPAAPEPLPRATPDIKVFPVEEPVEPQAPPVGFPDPDPGATLGAEMEEGSVWGQARAPDLGLPNPVTVGQAGLLPDVGPHLDKLLGVEDIGKIVGEKTSEPSVVHVQRTDAAVVIHADGYPPLAFPADATETQITEVVEMYRASMEVTK